MKIIRDIKSMQEISTTLKLEGVKTGLVPTMGFLHGGHISLIDRSVKENQETIVSIFVNPIQFERGGDFERYPREPERDLNIINKRGAGYVFLPEPDQMYEAGYKTYVQVKSLSRIMCGKFRPGHFDGVCTVVLKLLNIVKPYIVYFGLKDYQQFIIIRRMIQDLNLGAGITGCPTVRESDGLAMSSRNEYLSKPERKSAAILYDSLRNAASAIQKGEKDLKKIKTEMLAELGKNSHVLKVDYFDFRNPDNLSEIKNLEKYLKENLQAKILIASAVWIGKTRLIDNIII